MRYDFINDADTRYRSILREECRKLFGSIQMPSHDHLHHERVWENASMLLGRLYEASLVTDPHFPDKAIIAAFFHDTGLTLNRGAYHGRDSRQLCSMFLEESDLSAEDRQEILDAVEKHDDKEYQALSDPASLSALISVADDMDAFGETGIERYAEIYAMRGVPADEMPLMIIANVRSRLRHLENTYHMFPDIIAEQQNRAKIVTDHFTELIK